MKKRSYTLMTYALAILLGVALFLTSERVQRAEHVYDDIQEKLTTEREAYHILQTEWTYLNRPDRLEDLATTHLKLSPLKPDTTLTSAVNLPVMIQKSEEEKSIISAAKLNTVAPASGETPLANNDTVAEHASAKTIAAESIVEKNIATDTPTAQPTPAIIPVSTSATSAHTAGAVPAQPTKSTRPARAHQNTSTAGVTFYQYMNRGAAHKAAGGTQ